jgi:hypothetical protein
LGDGGDRGGVMRIERYRTFPAPLHANAHVAQSFGWWCLGVLGLVGVAGVTAFFPTLGEFLSVGAIAVLGIYVIMRDRGEETGKSTRGGLAGRLMLIATCVWISGFFIEVISIDDTRTVLPTRPVEFVLLAAVTCVAVLGTRVSQRAILRTVLAFAVCFGLVLLYDLLLGVPDVGSSSSYLLAGLGFAGTYGLTATFAAVFYSEKLFVRVFERVGVLSLCIALGAFGLSAVTGSAFLVNSRIGEVGRLQGLLSEPSMWGPVLAALATLALRRRSIIQLVLVAVAALLARSPTVFLTIGISLPLYYLLTARFQAKRIFVVAVMVAALVLSANFIRTADPNRYLESSNPTVNSVGRLLSGVQNIQTSGGLGKNDRFGNIRQTFADRDEGGWKYTGAGPDADTVYFSVKYPGRENTERAVAPNALWAATAFNFGDYGMLVLLVLIGIAVVRMRYRPLAAAVLLPFCVASMINSSPELYKFALLAILLFTFGWAFKPSAFPKRTPSMTFTAGNGA